MPTNLTNYVRQINGPLFDGTLSRGNSWGVNATGVFDFYVDPVAGNDNNPGTLLRPLKTLGEFDARVPTTCVSATYRCHLKAATYVMPGNNIFLRARLFMGGLVEIFADEAWDAAVYTVAASGVAGVATSATVIIGAGLVVDPLTKICVARSRAVPQGQPQHGHADLRQRRLSDRTCGR